MRRSDGVKLGLAAVLFGVAVALYVTKPLSESTPSELADVKSVWYCLSCQKGFELSLDQMRNGVAQGRIQEVPQDADGSEATGPRPLADSGGRTQIARCPRCRQWAGRPAWRCASCAAIYVAQPTGGGPASCPRCNTNPAAERKAQGP